MPAEYVLVVPTGTQSGACQRALAKDQMVNINGSEDQFYRYKMPQLVCTVPNAHASKMVKTSLCNIEKVSLSLQRPPSCESPVEPPTPIVVGWSMTTGTPLTPYHARADLPNFMGYTMSAKAEYNAKKTEGENCYVSGNYSTEDLNALVTKFIKEWVLCPKCNNPELNMKVKNKKGGQGSIGFDCSACGYSGKQKSEIMTGLPKMVRPAKRRPLAPAAPPARQTAAYMPACYGTFPSACQHGTAKRAKYQGS
jgi:translation initiation factor 2 beta subunit (eIF-2beta)/eIF-5